MVDVVVRLGDTTVCTICDKPEILLKLTPASRNGRIGPCIKRFFFARHYHRNAYGRDGSLEMITTGPVGKPLGKDPSGIRIAVWTEAGIEQEYYGLGSIPHEVPVRK